MPEACEEGEEVSQIAKLVACHFPIDTLNWTISSGLGFTRTLISMETTHSKRSLRPYRAVTPADRHAAVRADIGRFLAEARDVEIEFQELFKPEVIPTGFAPTTRAFLETIAHLLSD